MIFNTDFATSTILTKPTSQLHIEMLKFAKSKGYNNVVILDELKVINPEDFGKGYGKELLQKLFGVFDFIVAYPSFVFFEKEGDPDSDIAYSGREAMSIESLESAGEDLLNNFYIPQAKKAKRKIFTAKSTGEKTFILMVNENE